MLQIGRKLKLLSILLVCLLAQVDARSYVFDNRLCANAEILQHVDKHAVFLRKRCKNVCGFYGLASLSPRPLHRAFEEIRSIRSDLETLLYKTAAHFKALIDEPPNHVRIYSEIAECC